MIWGLRSVGFYCWISVIYIYISVISGWVVWLRDFLLISSYFPFSGWALYRTFLGTWTVPNAFRASPSRTVASLLALAVAALRSATWWKSHLELAAETIHNFVKPMNFQMNFQTIHRFLVVIYMNWIPSCRSTSNSQQAIYDKNDQLKLAGRFFHDVLMINTLCTKNPIFLGFNGWKNPIARPQSCARPMWPFPCKSQARDSTFLVNQGREIIWIPGKSLVYDPHIWGNPMKPQ